MEERRRVEVFSAGCPACEPVVQLVKSIACPSCDVQVLDMNQPYGVNTVPAVAINGKLAGYCSGAGSDESTLRAEGLGVAL